MSIYFKSSITGEVYCFDTYEDRETYGPAELVEMTPEEVYAFLNPPPPVLTTEEIRDVRRRLYADPITGSDKLFIEYQREIAMGASEAVIAAAKEHWLQRALEIEAEFPWPVAP